MELLDRYQNLVELHEGMDVSELLNIQKWEAPIATHLSGEVRGTFPSFLPKTDQERVQNLANEVCEWQERGLTFEVSEKLEGSSLTLYVYNEDEGVCSRNLNLKESDTNTYWKTVRREQLIEKVRQSGKNLALQGELIGEKIQGNIYNIKGHEFFLFDIYDIDTGTYFSPRQRRIFAHENDIKHVPVLEVNGDLNLDDDVIQSILERAEDVSVLNSKVEREGIVFKCNENPFIHFKAISNRYLIGQK